MNMANLNCIDQVCTAPCFKTYFHMSWLSVVIISCHHQNSEERFRINSTIRFGEVKEGVVEEEDLQCFVLCVLE